MERDPVRDRSGASGPTCTDRPPDSLADSSGEVLSAIEEQLILEAKSCCPAERPGLGGHLSHADRREIAASGDPLDRGGDLPSPFTWSTTFGLI